MKTILFQGDSITDCHRFRKATDKKQNSFAFFKDGKLLKKITALGDGYPAMVSAELESKFPGKYKYINKGVSGDRIPDVYSRIVQDIINIKPDYMSLLVGVNDVWHELGENPNGVDAEKFFKIYSMLIEEVKEALPNIKIMILEPFVLPGCSTTEKWDEFSKEVPKRAEMAKKIAGVE